MKKNPVCDWCGNPGDLQPLWEFHVCDACEQRMIDDLNPGSPDDGVRYNGTYWRAVCSHCNHSGPGASSPAEAKALALVEEFVVRDGVMVCKLCDAVHNIAEDIRNNLSC